MELQFQSTPLRCLRCTAADSASAEQTLEVRIGEGQPPVGRVLGAWGQPLIRGKEWQTDQVRVNGGVMVRTLYEAEDGSGVACVEGWIPFQLRWELSDSHADGIMIVNCQLRSMDVRQIGAEKLMLRATVSAYAQAMEREEYPVYAPSALPEDIQIRQACYPVCVPVEVGETPLTLEEELILPPGKGDVERILFYSLTPSVSDKKVMADKMVFRGTAALHMGYLGTDGMLHVYDAELPMSQYGELEREYGPEAGLWVEPMVSDMELESLEDGRIRLKAGLVGQYVVSDKPVLCVVQDAYSPGRQVQPEAQKVKLPAILEERTEPVSVRQSVQEQADRVVDCTVLTGQPRLRQEDGFVSALVEGATQLLYYDAEGRLQCVTTPFEEQVQLAADKTAGVCAGILTAGRADAVPAGEEVNVQAEPMLWLRATQPEGITMVTGLTVGEETRSDPNRPSLILRRAGDMSLWELAKKCGSTVEAIKSANGLEGEPDHDKMLLIPIS